MVVYSLDRSIAIICFVQNEKLFILHFTKWRSFRFLMSLLFLVILTLFLPSCAGANLRKLGASSTMNIDSLSTVVEEISPHMKMLKGLWPTVTENAKSNQVSVSEAIFKSKFEEVAARTHTPLVLKGGKTLELAPLSERMESYFDMGLSEVALQRLLLLELERGYRWDKGQILHKGSETAMNLQRTEKETALLKDSASTVRTSSIGRDVQAYGENGEKMMAFCILLRRKDGTPLVKDLWYAEREDVEMVVISSSNQAKTSWITVKGGRNEGESSETAALRETLEESGVR